jgi:predicted site-specific integrase-resolvase
MKLDPKAQAERLGVTPKTLANWRYTGIGPPFFKYGDGRVVYDDAETEAWLATRRRRSTSDPGVASSPPAAA